MYANICFQTRTILPENKIFCKCPIRFTAAENSTAINRYATFTKQRECWKAKEI